MEKVVISLGGSILFPDKINVEFLKKVCSLIKRLSNEYKIYIVVGGGVTARKYIKTGRSLGFDEEKLDDIGIDITRLNAKFFANLIEGANKKIPATTSEAKEIKEQIVIMGGTTPGHSTDMVGAELAEKLQASRYIIATDVDGVYDKDPKKYRDAKQLKEVTIDHLIKKFGTKWDRAGKNTVIDGPALEIIKRSKIPTFVLNGKKLKELENAITGKEFKGTKIKV